MLAKILVTSAWPYINYVPHLGNIVSSILSADVVARYYRLKGHDVVYVTGSDEHESVEMGEESEREWRGEPATYKVARSVAAANVVNTIDVYEDFPFSV